VNHMDLHPVQLLQRLRDPLQLIAGLEGDQLGPTPTCRSNVRRPAREAGCSPANTRCFRSLTAYATRLLPLTSKPTSTIGCPLSLVVIAHRGQLAHQASTVNQLKGGPIHRIS
jgi:hypothetical protein